MHSKRKMTLPVSHVATSAWFGVENQILKALYALLVTNILLLAQVWTYAGRVAFVLSVTDNDQPISEAKLSAFKGRLLNVMNEDGDGIVRVFTVIPHPILAFLSPQSLPWHSFRR